MRICAATRPIRIIWSENGAPMEFWGKYQQGQAWLAAVEILDLRVKRLGRIHGDACCRKSATGGDRKPRGAKSRTRTLNVTQRRYNMHGDVFGVS